MIHARYDAQGNIILDVKLIGRCGEKKVKTLFDTGFSGALAIPVALGCEIGLESIGDAKVTVASGEAIAVPLFLGKVEIGEEKVECIYIVLPGSEEVLLGMEVIKDYDVAFHGAKRAITIKKGAVEAAEGKEETMIEPSVVATPTPLPEVSMPIPPAPILVPEVSVVAPEATDRMQALKQTLREVVPR